MEEARSRGELWTNSFVRLRKLPVDRALMLDIIDQGDAEKLLDNPRHLGGAARQLLKRGIMPTEDGWGGWLGRYQSAICRTPVRSRSATSGTWLARKCGAEIGRADDDRRHSGHRVNASYQECVNAFECAGSRTYREEVRQLPNPSSRTSRAASILPAQPVVYNFLRRLLGLGRAHDEP